MSYVMRRRSFTNSTCGEVTSFWFEEEYSKDGVGLISKMVKPYLDSYINTLVSTSNSEADQSYPYTACHFLF